MNKNDLIRGGTLFKPLLVLVLSMVLLLSGAVLPAREAQAAPAAPKPTREVDLSQGNVTVKDKEVVRVYQNSGTTTVNNITVPNGVNATVILENVNRVLNGSGYAFFNIMENANVKILLKGKNKSTTSGTIAGLNVAIRKGSSLTIEDYGNGDGELDIAHLTNGGNSYPILGAIDGGTGSLTINSGKVIATSRYWGTAIGAGDNSTLNLTVNDPAVVEAHSLGQGAAIGTISGQTVNATVNATINGGTVRADNCSEWMIGSNMRAGAVIGTGVAEKGTQNVTLNIPKASTAKLYLDTFYGGAAIGGSGSANVAANGLLSGSSKQSVTANIEGGTLDIVVRGQGAGIGSGAGVTYNQTIEANIGGGNITIHNDLDIADTKAGDATGPAIGVGLLTQNATVTCNVTGGNLQMLSQDKGDKAAASPAIGVGAMNKKHPTTSKWTQSKGNTVNFNVKGGTISAETRSSDKTIMDVGAIENNDLNVKVDGGSFNVVNGQMSVKAQNSKTKDVYPATVCLGNMSGTSTVDSATIDGQSYGSDLKTQSGKLYLWTTPGIKKIIASVAGDSRDYTNPKADLAYGSGFTFTEPNVSLKKTVVPADLGRFSIKSVGEDNVTVQVSGVVSGVPVAVQAFDHLTGKPVGNPQSVTSGKTDYTFTGLSKNKTYDIKTFVSDQENYWEAESDAFMVKPFAYAPELADAQLRGPYEGSVAVGNGDYTYALAPGAALPEGLKLTRDGQITGTPTATGSTIFNVIATAADQDIAQGNSRTATVTLNVVPITSEATLVDALGQPLEGCSCKIETQTLNDEIGVGDVVAYTVTPCPEHVFVKFNLNGQDIGAGGVQVVNGIAKYSYTVKPGDKNLNMRAFMDNREIIGLEKVSEAPDLDLFANDEKNTSAEKLQSHIDNSVVLRATYNDNTTKEGKASELGLSWTTNDGYNLKGNTYHYVVSSGDASVKQVLTVNSVKAELNPLNDVMRTVSAEGYPTIEALGLPKTADCQYPDGVTVSEADRHPAINWTTEVPADFGKTATEAPVVFEGTAAVPAWATITSNAVSVNVSIRDGALTITGLEKVGEAPDLNLFANDENNASAEELQSYIDHNIILKATYNNGTTKNGKASDLGLNWATNDAYNLKGNTYHYVVRGGDAMVEQVLTVNSVNAELDPLNDIMRTVSADGYPTIEALGLPKTVGCKYPAGVTVSEADRQPAINWTTEVPVDFGKTATETPVVFEGTAAVPAWATITSNAVSVNVSISDKVILIPEIKIADKVYDGTKDAVVAETPALDPASLIAGSEVQLEGTAVAVFNAADAGNNIPVKVTGLTLTGADAGRYILDLNQATGNIIPATITLSDITLEDKTVTEDGNPQTLEIKGTLPEGVSVSYTYEREGSGEAVNLPPSVPGTYTVTATFKTDANHVVEPETMSAKLVIKEKTAGVVVEEITTGLTEEQAAGMNAAILKNGEAVQVGDTVMAGDKLTYQFAPAAVREAYVPYAFTMNGETVVLTKLAEGKGYSAEYTIKEGDTALKADAKCVLLGNFSGDDKINIIDAQQIAQTAAAGGEIGDIQKAAGDVNFDGKINVIDAQRVAQYAADTSVVF